MENRTMGVTTKGRRVVTPGGSRSLYGRSRLRSVGKSAAEGAGESAEGAGEAAKGAGEAAEGATSQP